MRMFAVCPPVMTDPTYRDSCAQRAAEHTVAAIVKFANVDKIEAGVQTGIAAWFVAASQAASDDEAMSLTDEHVNGVTS